MDIEVIRRMCLARHLYELGISSLRSSNDLYLFSGVNLLQDAVEAFLLAVADHLVVSFKGNENFNNYFELINKKIAPKELPFKNRLLRLNRIRVDSKHHGIQPARDECNRLVESVREFFEEVSSSILGVNFSTVSTIDLLDDGEVKTHLLEAKNLLENGKIEECSIECRKAIYLELERWYDISQFKDKDDKSKGFWLLSASCNAPYYARNPEYIQKNVKNPTDYIVYDHSSLDQELLKYSVDNTAFWNIWRLTPKVYRTQDKTWIVKHDFDKLEKEILEDKIEYIFSTTVDILFAIHTKNKSVRTSEYSNCFLELNTENVPVYEKADEQSNVVGITPAGVTKLDCDFYVTGLDGSGPYWFIRCRTEKDILGIFLSGYIHNNYVKQG